MGKIRVTAGAWIMLAVALVSGRCDLFLLYGLSALLHETGHLLAAFCRKIKVDEIRIDVSGARIRTKEGAGSYLDEFILCMSGPLVNALVITLGAAFFVCQKISISGVAADLEAFVYGERNFAGALAFLMLCSLFQGAFNLLPIKTFDGGRMLYCTCALLLGQRVGERVISALSALCLLVIWTAALYLLLRLDSGLSVYTFAACIFFSTLCDRELLE